AALFGALLQHCSPATKLAVAVDLTGAEESISQRSVAEWRRQSPNARPSLEKRPSVFCLLA
ncbi:MAG: SAM-dependent methyltransferase, partial [Burkholderiaceae bacterium]